MLDCGLLCLEDARAIRIPTTEACNLRDLDEYLVPIDGDAGNSGDLCFSLELENARAPVTSCFELGAGPSEIVGVGIGPTASAEAAFEALLSPNAYGTV